MPRNITTGIFTRVSNSFSNPVYGTVIDPTDADSLFDDYDGGLTFNDSEPLMLVGSTSGALTILAPDTASGTITLPAGTTDFSATGGTGHFVRQDSAGAPFTVTTVPASAISSPAALTRVDDTNVTLTLGGAPSTALLAATSITAGWSGQLSLARGGTNANLTASNGGLLYSTASAAAILAGTATAGQIPRSGSNSAPSWSAATFPGTTAAGTILASATANTIAGTATPTFGVSGSLLGTLTLAGSTSGSVLITPQAAAGTTTLTAPNTSGTIAASATAPITLNATTGAIGVNGSALTKTDDTNVTLTLGGTPATALLAAASITAGWTGQLAVSRGGTGLSSGTSGGILGYTASGALASSAALAANGIVIGGGAGATPTAITAGTNGQLLLGVTSSAPSMATMSGDATIANTGALTIANSAVSNAKLANSAAYTLKGNFTGSSAAPQDSTIGALTQKASPAATDLVLIQDQAASGQLKYAEVAAIASAGSVSSIAGNTGAFTLANGIGNTGNQIELTAARRTLPTTQDFSSGSGTYTTPANVLWIEVYVVGGGGGGSGGSAGGAGGAGGNSSFGSLTANGGGGGSSTAGGAGGSASGGKININGTNGGGAPSSAAEPALSGMGGSNPFGPPCGGVGGAGSTGLAGGGYGGGGSGAAFVSGTNFPGGGGGGGGFIYQIINSPSATYSYAVGAAGTAGSAAAGSGGGGVGKAGRVLVIEHYGS